MLLSDSYLMKFLNNYQREKIFIWLESYFKTIVKHKNISNLKSFVLSAYSQSLLKEK